MLPIQFVLQLAEYCCNYIKTINHNTVLHCCNTNAAILIIIYHNHAGSVKFIIVIRVLLDSINSTTRMRQHIVTGIIIVQVFSFAGKTYWQACWPAGPNNHYDSASIGVMDQHPILCASVLLYLEKNDLHSSWMKMGNVNVVFHSCQGEQRNVHMELHKGWWADRFTHNTVNWEGSCSHGMSAMQVGCVVGTTRGRSQLTLEHLSNHL